MRTKETKVLLMTMFILAMTWYVSTHTIVATKETMQQEEIVTEVIDIPEDIDKPYGIMSDIYTKENCIEISPHVTETVAEPMVIEPKPIIKPLDPTTMYTNDILNMRESFSTKSEVVKILGLGTEVTVIGEKDNWKQIQLSDGQVGFVSGEYLQDTNMLTYAGKFKLTFYNDCPHCCGKAHQNTASGTKPVEGRTIATGGQFPFGTKLYFGGNIFTVEDRGNPKYVSGNVIDVYTNLNDVQCRQLGVKYTDVYIYNP